ncbi:MAG: TlpA family protein disulfide reductase [Pirellulaceae bacterium]|nr:TlpA family protein disulfide reductase [Pirellulaceae bacterium]
MPVHNLITFAALLCSLLCGAVAPAEDRQLILPKNFEAVTVSLFDQPEPAEYMTGFLYFATEGRPISVTHGVVDVPENSIVSIGITAQGDYLRAIEALSEKGVDRLEIHGAELSTAFLKRLETLTSLRELVCVDCKLGKIDTAILNGAPKLQKVSIRSENSRESSRIMLPWLAKCPAIQSMPSGLRLSVEELRMFSHHRGSLFLESILDERAEETLAVLGNIKRLVGIGLSIEKDVAQRELELIAQLKHVELIVLNSGTLNSELVRVFASLPHLRALRVQGSTVVSETFLEGLSELSYLESISFTRPFDAELHSKFMAKLLQMDKIRELPQLQNATAEQLARIASRGQYSELHIAGLDRTANEDLLANAVRMNPDLRRLRLANIELSSELGAAIARSKQLVSVGLDVELFNGEFLDWPASLSKLNRLQIGSKRRPRRLDVLSRIPNLSYVEVSLQTFDRVDLATIASLPSLRSLEVENCLCDDYLATALEDSRELKRLSCRQNCLMTDSGIKKLARLKNLESLQVGGFLTESAVIELAALPRLKYLSIESDRIDQQAITRLRERFSDQKYLEIGPLNLSLGKIAEGSDGLLRWLPVDGRARVDELEGRTVAEIFPSHLLKDVEGWSHGKLCLVEFWGTWCGPCLAYVPELERLYEKYHGRGFEILSVHSSQGAETADKYIAEHPLPWHCIIDQNTELERSFRGPSYPSLYLFDVQGRLAVALPHRLVLEQTIESLLPSK